MAEEQSLESWNMAKAYLQRIDQLLTTCTQCHYSTTAGNMWYYSLISLRAELYPKLTEAEKKEINTKIASLRNKRNSKEKKTNAELYMDVELYLRERLEKKGLLTPKADDPTKAYRG